MYNLLVTGEENAWEKGFYRYDRSRFLEYTNKDIAAVLRELDNEQIENLKSYPCLFAYEGRVGDVRIGYLTSIKPQGRSLIIEFEFVTDIPAIAFSKLEPFAQLLDIRDWEMNRTHWAVKDVDLFSVLTKQKIISNFEKEESEELIPPISSKKTDLAISSVQGFIEKVLQSNQKNECEVFYRGHSKNKYKLEPSLFRTDDDGNYLYLEQEDTLYRELIVSNSADFQFDGSALDKLIRMQHYSLPTRLLDITSNPLIALYFACKTSLYEEGEVIVTSVNKNKIKYFDSDVVSCIANLARLPWSEKKQINFELEDFNSQRSIRRLLHFIKEEKPFFTPSIEREDLRDIVCVKAKQSDSRITAQSGAFLLFGLDAVFNENGTDNIKITRIPVNNKESILEELDLLNINESTVFPYLESSARYISNKFKFRK